ncbi:U-box domain-containing protein 29-like [Canna indica]|uniref:U-box domain-containing protein n=1 Tax=Canna indica TaxID=4628 RepID=A0AAQ3L696_9LILI|nr:U-box domain-containing protein 29-like [Canna indica]
MQRNQIDREEGRKRIGRRAEEEMGRRREKGGRLEGLEVKLPSFFRCPISLEVMQSPVSLCTGVTYDRSSIQSWLDSGHRTCPATRLPLSSPVHLVPNLTLRRLIRLWSSSSAVSSVAVSPLPPPPPQLPSSSVDLLLGLRSSSPVDDPLPLLRRLSAFFSSDADDSDKNRLASSDCFAPAIVSRAVDESAGLETLSVAIKILALVLGMDCIEESGRELAVAALFAELDGSFNALIRVLRSREGSQESRIDAARVLESILLSSSCDRVKRSFIVEKPDLFPEIVRLIAPPDNGGAVHPESADAGLQCLLAAAKGKGALARMARAGAVPALARVLAAAEVPAATAELALKAMKAMAGSSEGRAEICETAEACVGGVMGRVLKVGREGKEAAVTVLWAACVAAGDRRAREAVAGAKGGAAKVLVVMQGDCSPAAAMMAGELLKIFKVDAKSCCVGYDTKTTHIMPY